MAPLKKSKKDSNKLKKIKAKNKKNKSINIVPVENKGTECDWWDSFWHKNSSTPGPSLLKFPFFNYIFANRIVFPIPFDLLKLCKTLLKTSIGVLVNVKIGFLSLISANLVHYFNPLFVKFAKHSRGFTYIV